MSCTLANLTGDNIPDDFFEGREKLLEVWFAPSQDPANVTKRGLRDISREDIESMLDCVRCKILDCMSNDYLDSYVLSESSLFVAENRIVLKTCGQTSLLPAVPMLLKLARSVGLTQVEDFFFSHQEMLLPQAQPPPHTSFADEVQSLDERFDGAAYCLGRLNSNSAWYLYTLNPDRPLGEHDQSIEIMMHDLDKEAMSIFYKGDLSDQQVTVDSGIASLFPDATIHEFLFDPCGYSCNGILNENFFNIHVTPQPEFSFVSFETDIPVENYTDLVNRVLDIFKPGRFTLSLFMSKHRGRPHASEALVDSEVTGYRRRDKQSLEFNRYTLNFGHFVKKGVPTA